MSEGVGDPGINGTGPIMGGPQGMGPGPGMPPTVLTWVMGGPPESRS